MSRCATARETPARAASDDVEPRPGLACADHEAPSALRLWSHAAPAATRSDRAGHDARVGEVERRPAVDADEVDDGAAEAEAVDEIADRAAEDDAERRRGSAAAPGRAPTVTPAATAADEHRDDRAGAGEAAERDARVVVELDPQAAAEPPRQPVGHAAHEPLADLVDGEDRRRQRRRRARAGGYFLARGLRGASSSSTSSVPHRAGRLLHLAGAPAVVDHDVERIRRLADLAVGESCHREVLPSEAECPPCLFQVIPVTRTSLRRPVAARATTTSLRVTPSRAATKRDELLRWLALVRRRGEPDAQPAVRDAHELAARAPRA